MRKPECRSRKVLSKPRLVPQYRKCILTAYRGVTWCGRKDHHEWAFMDLRHAEDAVAQGERQVPCEACIKAARASVQP